MSFYFLIKAMEIEQPQNLSKKERREIQREERTSIDETHRRKEIAKRWSMRVSILVAVVGVIGGVVYLIQPTAELGQSFPNQGQDHIAVGALHADYNSNPPTSGPHYADPAAWGVYEKELPDEQLVHNLEHGGIWISYSSVDVDTKIKIEAFAKAYPNKMIVTPRAKDTTKIALASWTRLLTLDQFDEERIVAFIKANKNKSPEPMVE